MKADFHNYSTGDLIETPGFEGTRIFRVDSILLGAVGFEDCLELAPLDRMPPNDAEGKPTPIYVPLEMIEAGITSGLFILTSEKEIGQ